ncbi:MAG: class I SAM-dependent methyltransferase [Rhodospirillaceae bacterium]
MSFSACMRKMDFDGSVFNHISRVLTCPRCGFLETKSPFSDLENEEHYAKHILYHSMGGVGVGNETAEDLARYKKYLGLLDDLKGLLVDIGCSKGGWLKFLRKNVANSLDLIGLDVDPTSLSDDPGTCDILFAEANVFNTGLSDGSADFLTYFHVLEHIDNLDSLLSEAFRILKSDGKVLIEVPNATRYASKIDYVGPGFWLFMQEHLNHFSLSSLESLSRRNGFIISDYKEETMPMKNGFGYPSLIVKMRKSGKGDYDLAKQFGKHFVNLNEFVKNEIGTSQRMADEILSLCNPLVFWGIGLEFFNCFSKLQIPADIEWHLLDGNVFKHKCTDLGKVILAPEAIRPTGTLIISSYLAEGEISEQAQILGWNSDNMVNLSDIASGR